MEKVRIEGKHVLEAVPRWQVSDCVLHILDRRTGILESVSSATEMPPESQDSELTVLPESQGDAEIAPWIVGVSGPARRSTREPQPTVQHAEEELPVAAGPSRAAPKTKGARTKPLPAAEVIPAGALAALLAVTITAPRHLVAWAVALKSDAATPDIIAKKTVAARLVFWTVMQANVATHAMVAVNERGTQSQAERHYLIFLVFCSFMREIQRARVRRPSPALAALP